FESVLKSLRNSPADVFSKVISSIDSVEDQIPKHWSPTCVTDDLLPGQQIPILPETIHSLSHSTPNTDTSVHHSTTNINNDTPAFNNDTPVFNETCSESLNMNQPSIHPMPLRRSSRHHNIP
ncbi:hypothetical protein HAX54_001015, partial [Datura stramonium]|nr:hypothetical protein [Datura stramonium]